jgi:hypothetical protein
LVDFSMSRKFREIGLDWEGSGYFGVPDPSPAPRSRPGSEIDPWDLWIAVFQRAKQGDFTHVPDLIPILMTSSDWLLVTTCSDLIGDAGPDVCFESILEGLRNTDDFLRATEYCQALYIRGKLSDVPTLAITYEKYKSRKDADIFPVWISDLLEIEDGPLPEPAHFEDVEDYREAVIDAYRNLVDELGSDQVFVFNGKRFGVSTVAKLTRQRIGQPVFRSIFRRKFEASTGIDCTRFYKREKVQPLAAAAIVEEFLESGEAAKYREGARYFFGHPIPG